MIHIFGDLWISKEKRTQIFPNVYFQELYMEPNSVCGKRDSVGHRLRVLQQLTYPMLRTNPTGEHCNIGAQVLSLSQTCGGSWGFFVAVKSPIAGYLIKEAKN